MDGLGAGASVAVAASRPDQDFALLIHRKLSGVDKFGFEIIDVVVIQGKLSLQRPIGDPSMALEQAR